MKISSKVFLTVLLTLSQAHSGNKGGGGGGVIISKEDGKYIYQTVPSYIHQAPIDITDSTEQVKKLKAAVDLLVEQMNQLSLPEKIIADLRKAILPGVHRRYYLASDRSRSKDAPLQALKKQSIFIHRVCGFNYGIHRAVGFDLSAYTQESATYLFPSFFKLGGASPKSEEVSQMASVLFLEALRVIFPIEYATCQLETKQIQFEDYLKYKNSRFRELLMALWKTPEEIQVKQIIKQDKSLKNSISLGEIAGNLHLLDENKRFSGRYLRSNRSSFSIKYFSSEKAIAFENFLPLRPNSEFFREYYNFFKGPAEVEADLEENGSHDFLIKKPSEKDYSWREFRLFFENAILLFDEFSVIKKDGKFSCKIPLKFPVDNKYFMAGPKTNFAIIFPDCNAFGNSHGLTSGNERDTLLKSFLSQFSENLLKFKFQHNYACYKFDYGEGGNLRNLICKISSLIGYRENLGEFFTNFYTDSYIQKYRFLNKKRDFNAYNLETLSRAAKYYTASLDVLPLGFLQNFYNKNLRKVLRKLFLVRKLMQDRDFISNDINQYKITMRAHKHYTKSYAGIWFLAYLKKKGNIFKSYNRTYYYYWLRRIMDGSDPQIFELLDYSLEKFDPEFRDCVNSKQKSYYSESFVCMK